MKAFSSFNLSQKQIPELIPPFRLILIKGLSTIAKFSLPLILQSIYEDMKYNNNTFKIQFLLLMLIKIVFSVSGSYFLQLLIEQLLTQYRLQVKKQLTKRIIQNNILNYIQYYNDSVKFTTKENNQIVQNQLENQVYQNTKDETNQTNNENKYINHQIMNNQNEKQQLKMNLWSKIASKMPIYVYNYYNSLLALIFQTLNIIGVCVYLFTKLSYSLFFGLLLAFIIMKKVISVTKQIRENNFNNIKLQQKKHSILQTFFNSLIQYKMTWLDKYIYDIIQQNQNKYQQNLQKNKLLDCWCVMLWRFTSVSLSSIIIISFYLFDIHNDNSINPATLISFLMILTMPLNGLSWNIAGYKNSLRAINQLKNDVKLLKIQKNSKSNQKHNINLNQKNIQPICFKQNTQFVVKQKIKNKKQNLSSNLNQSLLLQKQSIQQFIIFNINQQFQLNNSQIIQIIGDHQLQIFLQNLPFIIKNKINDKYSYEIGYVEQNAWQIENIMQSILMRQASFIVNNQMNKIINKDLLIQLLQLFECHDIPQFQKITYKQLSGGQKMRINLVRAFYNTFNNHHKIIIINSDLSCFDLLLSKKIAQSIKYLTRKYGYTVICKKLKNVYLGNKITTLPYLRFQKQNKQKFNNKIKQLIYIYYHKQMQVYTSQQVHIQYENRRPYKQINNKLKQKIQLSLKLYKQNQIRQQQMNQIYQNLHKKTFNLILNKKNKSNELPSQINNQIDQLNLQQYSCKQQNKNILNLKIFLIYYKSKLHYIFLIGIIATTICQNYYNYYLNNFITINNIQNQNNKKVQINQNNTKGISKQNVLFLLFITLLFAFCLWIRSYFFAIANVKQAKRLSKNLNQNVILNSIKFYQSQTHQQFNQNIHKKQSIKQKQFKLNQFSQENHSNNNKQINESEIDNRSQLQRLQSCNNRLIYNLTKDSETVSDWYPWHANILFNNIFTILSSVIIISNQIPFILILFIPIILYTMRINSSYQNYHQKYIKMNKKIQQKLMKSINQLEQGIKYLYLFDKLELFKFNYYKYSDKQLNIQWKIYSLKKQLNIKYKTIMLLFLISIIIAYGISIKINQSQHQLLFQKYLNSHFYIQQQNNFNMNKQNENNESGKFALIIHYTMLLTNYMLYFTCNLADTFTQANSIQRIHHILSQQNRKKSQERYNDFKIIINKIMKNYNDQKKNLLSQYNVKIINNLHQKNIESQKKIQIKGLNFSYNKKIKNKQKRVFKDLDLVIKNNDKIQIKGKSGDGKTTLYKLLCSLYKEYLQTINLSYHISFSPQHPLILPQKNNVIDNIDPYNIYGNTYADRMINIKNILFNQSQKCQKMKKNELTLQLLQKNIQLLNYQQKIIINNIRAWIYGGKNGLKIYDQPYWVNQSSNQTYIITTHHRSFQHNRSITLQNAQLIQNQIQN